MRERDPDQFTPFLVQRHTQLGACRLGSLMPFEHVSPLQVLLKGFMWPLTRCDRADTRRAGRGGDAAGRAIAGGVASNLDGSSGPPGEYRRGNGRPAGSDWTEVPPLATGKLEPDGSEDGDHAHIHYCSQQCSAHESVRQLTLPFYERGTGPAATVMAERDPKSDGRNWSRLRYY